MSVYEEALAAHLAPRVEGYELLRVLGEGGQARVYEARDPEGTRVSLKHWLDPNLGPEARERIRREASALEGLSHPNLACLLGTASLSEGAGAPCLVLELIEGTSLAELIRQAGRLEPSRVAEVGAELAEGLAYLHARGLVHRDLKPSNVILRQQDGKPVLIDLGIVKRVLPAGDEALDPLTRVEQPLGSKPFMAPEQFGAEPGAEPSPIDGRTDVYGLGALLFAAATGVPPWTHQGPWVRRHRSPWEDPVFAEVHQRREELPAGLRAVIARCLEGDPAARYPDAQAAAAALRSALEVEAAPRPRLDPEQALLTLAVLIQDAPLSREALQTGLDAGEGLELAGAPAGEAWLAFATPSAATACALQLQALLRASAPRIGVQWGEVTRLRQGPRWEVEGEPLEQARALADLARPGQLLLAKGAFDAARARLSGAEVQAAWQAYGPYRFAELGQGGALLGVCEVGDPAHAPLTPPLDHELASRWVEPGHELVLGWRPARGLSIPRRPNWILERKLGEGGFGEVWLALHRTTRDERAFKFCFQAERLRQLKREVILFTVLRDTLDKRWDIAQLLDWQFEEAPYFLESEYSPLGSLLDWAEDQGGLAELEPALRLELVAQVADALGAAHRAGVVHKDVKPSNVLIQSYGAAITTQLADFGVGGLVNQAQVSNEARDLSAQITSEGLSRLWTAEGGGGYSRLYRAPELLEGRPATASSDVYALGVMLYQAVRGDFSRALGSGWEREVEDPLLREDIALCVDHDPARRLGEADALAPRLRELDARRQARAVSEAQARERELLLRHGELVRQRRRWLAALCAALLLALWAWLERGREVRALKARVQELEAGARPK